MTRWTRVTLFGPGGEPLETVTGNVVLPAGTTTIGGRPRDIDITVFPYEPRPDGLILGSAVEDRPLRGTGGPPRKRAGQSVLARALK